MTEPVLIAVIAGGAAVFGAAVGQLPALLVALRNGERIHEVHLSLNSELAAWKAQVSQMISSANAQGRQDERDSHEQG